MAERKQTHVLIYTHLMDPHHNDINNIIVWRIGHQAVKFRRNLTEEF